MSGTRAIILAGIGAMLFAGCELLTQPADTGPIAAQQRYIAVSTADFVSSGGVSLIGASREAVRTDLVEIHSDNLIKAHAGALYVLEKAGADNIIRLSVSETGGLTADYQKDLGSGNLQDIAFGPGAVGYVTQHNEPEVLAVDLETGAVSARIDLSAYATFAGADSAESSPYASTAIARGDYVYVICQRLKTVQTEYGPSLAPGENGLVAVIGAASGTVDKTIALKRKNPASAAVWGDALYVSCTGAWGNHADGGLEKIDLRDHTHAGVVIEESDCGGDISTLCITAAHRGFLAVSGNSADFSQFWTKYTAIDPAAGAVGQTIEHASDAFGGIAFDGELLYIGDRGASDPGVVVVDAETLALVDGPLDCGVLAPVSIAILDR